MFDWELFWFGESISGINETWWSSYQIGDSCSLALLIVGNLFLNTLHTTHPSSWFRDQEKWNKVNWKNKELRSIGDMKKIQFVFFVFEIEKVSSPELWLHFHQFQGDIHALSSLIFVHWEHDLYKRLMSFSSQPNLASSKLPYPFL